MKKNVIIYIKGGLVMKKLILKLKIIMTNISRIIMSFLFVSLNFSYVNRVFGVSKTNTPLEITCYDVAGYDVGTSIETSNTLTLKNVLIILVPVVIIIGAIILIVKKKKSKSKEEKKNAKKD